MRAFKPRKVPKFHRETVNQKMSKKDGSISQIKLLFCMAIAALCGGIWIQQDLGFDLAMEEMSIFPSAKTWCEQVKEARDDLTMAHLRISYPCEGMKPAKSAIVCMLTDGSTEEKANRIVFTARDYINGAMSLGSSLHGNIDPSQTHQLLLLREGFELDKDDIIRLESVGWTIGTAPDFPLENKYLPTFPRYKTTYTKVTAIGLSEYKCVMLMDADTLAIGDLREVMKCDTTFLHPSNRVGGTLDWYRGKWLNYNTGSILWKTSAKEMERVFELTKDSSFMKRYGSDQDFLNNVYPDRINNRTLNDEVMALDTAESRKVGNTLGPVIPHSAARSSSVAPLSWDYNAQTHAEVHNWDFWNSHRSTVRILHFTEKKGWQCDRSTDEPPPPEEMPKKCDKKIPICFCREAHLYWRALERAEKLAEAALASHANNKASN